MEKKKILSTRKIALIGILSAICIVLGVTPLGFIPLGPVTYTIMHVPVIIGAIIGGPIVGAFVGLIFGLFSLLRAISTPTPISFVFINPLVSVLPRILIGIVSYYVYKAAQKTNKKTSVILMCSIFISLVVFLVNKLISEVGAYTNQLDYSIWNVITIVALLIVFIFVSIFSYYKFRNKDFEVVISAALGSLTNTIGVLGMIYILYAKDFVEKIGGDINSAGSVIIGVAISNGIPEMILSIVVVTSVVLVVKKTAIEY